MWYVDFSTVIGLNMVTLVGTWLFVADCFFFFSSNGE